MRNTVHDMLHDSPAARRIEALWQVSIILYSVGEETTILTTAYLRNMKLEKLPRQSS